MFLVSQIYSTLTCSLNLYHNIDTFVLSQKVNILIQLYYIYTKDGTTYRMSGAHEGQRPEEV